MGFLREFFVTNQIVVVFGYGLVYFLLGFALTLYSRRSSSLTVARALPLLGSFGILHGIAEWGPVFIPIQASYISSSAIVVLWALQSILLALSFTFLLQFGLRLLSEGLPERYGRLTRWAWALFGLWLALFAVTAWRMGDAVVVSWLDAGEVWSRWLIALPGALVTSYGLHLQTDEFRRLGLPRLLTVLQRAVLAFGLFAFVGGLIVPNSYMALARRLNTEVLFVATGVPAELWRGLVGLAIALAIVRMLEIFDVEEARRLEAAHRVETVLNERDRIARELHDGIIQRLYAVGLNLEAISAQLPKDDPTESRSRIEYVLQSLDESVRDIRQYITNLRSPIEDERSLEESLTLIASEFREAFGVVVTLEHGETQTRLRPEALNHLRQIVRESLTNAVRHGEANRLKVRVAAAMERVKVTVTDDGSGFDPERVSEHEGNGLRNMERRAQLMDGTFAIASERGRGTTVTVTVPR